MLTLFTKTKMRFVSAPIDKYVLKKYLVKKYLQMKAEEATTSAAEAIAKASDDNRLCPADGVFSE